MIFAFDAQFGTMATDPFKEWTPTVQLRHPDTLISSEYASAKIFRPSEEACMERLMANEYQRLWLVERDAWLKKIAASGDERKRPHRAIDVKDSNTDRDSKSSITSNNGRRKSNIRRGNSIN